MTDVVIVKCNYCFLHFVALLQDQSEQNVDVAWNKFSLKWENGANFS